MKPFLTTLTVGLLSVGSFVYWADPAYRWHRSMYPSHQMARGDHWPWPGENIDQVTAKTILARITDTADLVMLGSSRIVYPKYTMISDKVKVLNLAIGYASISKHKVLWDALRDAGHSPKYILIDLDPWTFNQSWVDNTRFYPDHQNTFNPLLELREIYSITSLRASIQSLQGVEKSARGYRWDGTIYNIDKPVVSTKDVTIVLPIDVQRDQFPRLMGPWKISQNEVESAKHLLQEISAQGIPILILLPPLHPTVYQAVKRNLAWWSRTQEYLSVVKRLATDVPKTTVCNAVNPDTFNCSDQEFTDSIHMDDRCAKKVIEGCFEQHIPWSELLANSSSD